MNSCKKMLRNGEDFVIWMSYRATEALVARTGRFKGRSRASVRQRDCGRRACRDEAGAVRVWGGEAGRQSLTTNRPQRLERGANGKSSSSSVSRSGQPGARVSSSVRSSGIPLGSGAPSGQASRQAPRDERDDSNVHREGGSDRNKRIARLGYRAHRYLASCQSADQPTRCLASFVHSSQCG